MRQVWQATDTQLNRQVTADPEPVVEGIQASATATFSPNGRWVAHVSDESGQDEVVVVSFPDQGSRRQVPPGSAGGSLPRWSRTGDELFYISGGNTIMRQRRDGP